MADRVQYVMDRMSVTFKDMEQFGLFTKEEVKSVVKKRTDFEYRLRRRQLTTSDFYGYLEYEMSLEELRELRCRKQRSGQNQDDESNASKEMINRHRKLQSAFMKHISYVFERALRRFPDEMELWDDYISFLQRKRAHSILNTIFGRALSLHPKNENLWIQAAVFEINENSNAHAARVLLQRGLRVNERSQKLWQTYFDLELWYGVRFEERRQLLGLSSNRSQTESDKKLKPQEELGIPWVVYRHATKSIDSLNFSVLLLKATGPGCAMTSLRSSIYTKRSSLQTEIQNDIRERFGESTTYWAAMTQLLIDEYLSAIEQKQQLDRRSKRKQLKKMSRDSNGTCPDRMMEVSGSVVLEKMRFVTGGLADCLELLRACSESSSNSCVDSTFLYSCWYNVVSSLSPFLYVPLGRDVSLSAVDLFRSQKNENSMNVIQLLYTLMDEASQFLQDCNSQGKEGETSSLDEALVLISRLSNICVQATLHKQCPDAISSRFDDTVGILQSSLSNALHWLSHHDLPNGNIQLWAILVKKAFRVFTMLDFLHCSIPSEVLDLCDLVMINGPLLLNSALTDVQQLHKAAYYMSSLSAELQMEELKTSILVEAMERALNLESENGKQWDKVNKALHSMLFNRSPTASSVGNEPTVSDTIYVDWLLRYTQLSLVHDGETGWRRACEFVESCLSAKPQCVTSPLALYHYYQHVVEQGMGLLRVKMVTKVDDSETTDFVFFMNNLVEKAASRCSSPSTEGQHSLNVSVFLEAKEEIQRSSGQYKQANHTRWKRIRVI